MAKEIKTERLTFRLRKSIKRRSRRFANQDKKTLGEWFEWLAEMEIGRRERYIEIDSYPIAPKSPPSGATLGKATP